MGSDVITVMTSPTLYYTKEYVLTISVPIGTTDVIDIHLYVIEMYDVIIGTQ